MTTFEIITIVLVVLTEIITITSTNAVIKSRLDIMEKKIEKQDEINEELIKLKEDTKNNEHRIDRLERRRRDVK